MIKHILKEGPEGTYHRRGDVEEWRINPYEVTTTNYKELFDDNYTGLSIATQNLVKFKEHCDEKQVNCYILNMPEVYFEK